ncbi:MAG: hypothetical protein M3P29_00790 [Acidobacteriota bacterium]|nr:hypothetical protein [Acidobacteriota bacterium]
MSFDWGAFLAVAEALANADIGVDREACLRSAVSRAYYAAFGSARHRARERRLQTRQSAAEHGEISIFFARQYGDAGIEIAKQLSRLRANRNIADYDDHCEDAEKLSAESLTYARQVLDLLATL